MKQRKNLKIGLAVVLLLALMAGMYAIYTHYSQKAQSGEKQISISIVFDDGSQKDYELSTDAEYLKEALEAVAEIDGEDGPYGYTLYTVDGVTADFNTGNVYWVIYVDGEYGTYSLSQQPVTDGAHYAIVYETY